MRQRNLFESFVSLPCPEEAVVMEMPPAHQAARLPRARVAVRLVAQLETGRGRSARSARADASAGVGSSRSSSSVYENL